MEPILISIYENVDSYEIAIEENLEPVTITIEESNEIVNIEVNEGGVTDHGVLTGLSDDDHSQYHTDERGDLRYSQLGHTHAASEVADFDTEVTNNTDVAANTTARHTHSNKSVLDAIQESLTTLLKTAYDSAVSWITTNGANLLNHLSNTSNPHSVTKAQIGLGSVDNTADANKEVSGPQQTALNAKVSGTLGTGRLVYSNAGAATDTALLSYDAVNGRVGLNTATPRARLDINGLVSTPAVGVPVAYITDDFNGISGVEMRNISTGLAADFRFMITNPGNQFTFSSSGPNNNQTLYGYPRNSTDFLFTGRGLALNGNFVSLNVQGSEYIKLINGRVGIFATAPNSTIEITHGAYNGFQQGVRLVNSSTGNRFLISVGNPSDNTSLTITDILGNSARIVINSSGIIGINTTTPAASAQLDITSTTRGFLPPRMTTAQRNAIASPATGLQLFCTDATATDGSTGVMQCYNGTTWKNFW